MSSGNFDWWIETIEPGRSRQKGHEETPGTNWLFVDNWPLTTRARVTFDIQRAFRTFNVHGGRDEHLAKFQKRADS